MRTVIKNLNYLTLLLQDTCLIEASAGTGKTYTLIMLYLRLLLGLNNVSTCSKLLSVKEILVVTFTEVATEELRGRIRDNIRLLRLACMQGNSNNPLLATLLSQIDDLQLAVLRLLTAERQMNDAAIYTIHSFCQHILNHNSIESGFLFQKTLLDNELFLQQQASADFWRRYFYPLPLEVARIVQQYWNGPDDLLVELLPYLQGELPIIYNLPEINESILERHQRIISNIKNLKQQWHAVSPLLLKIILNQYKLDNRVYNNKNVSIWITKIDRWARQPTIDYQVPNELSRFKSSVLTKKTIIGEPPTHNLFITIENFYKKGVSLRELILAIALIEIRKVLKKEKNQCAKIGFDDLLSSLNQMLISSEGEILAHSIRKKYPVAIIDEFQDTDFQQYHIFRFIYNNQTNCSLLLIGDPKQAIYAFRGADIFTYMRARGEVKIRYTLDTNWRSAPGVINAINKLFQNSPNPFVFNDIPYLPVRSASNNSCLRLVVKNQHQPAMRIWLQSGKDINIKQYQQYMAHQCANTICNLLYAANEGEAWLEGRYSRRSLLASDITVLVRNRNEAALIYNALSKLMIPSVYLSNRDSVFEMPEARELQWILEAILTPDKDAIFRRAFATRLLGFNATAIESLNKDEYRWKELVEKFISYRQRWQKNGILPMLYQMIIDHHIAENLLASQGGQRRLTDILHIGELLQETSAQIKNEFALVRWLALQIESPNSQEISQQLRLESDQHLVQIITIYKSKGLEYPLVFLPFAATFRVQKRPLFHDRQKYIAYLDFSATQNSLQLADEERLAEDLRLFYVALTRSIYHCSFGIAPLYLGNRRKNGTNDLHLSAPGYLIQQGKSGNIDDLRNQLTSLVKRSNGDIALCEQPLQQVQLLNISSSKDQFKLDARSWIMPQQDSWIITSYSNLQKQSIPTTTDSSYLLDINIIDDNNKKHKKLQLTPHTFPRGAYSGTFLHSLLEGLDFTQPLSLHYLHEKMVQYDIDHIWSPAIIQWIENIITTLLDGKSLSLSHLAPNSWYAELPFYLSIDKVVKAHDLDLLCKYYDPLSARCPSLNFQQFNGMLKGFIDLVFRWQGRYYLLDYKSNWLGDESSIYNTASIEQAMIAHRYELQYQLYTLVLHRFLRHRLIDYDYQRDFGGVYYLFLRGIDAIKSGNGIFYCRPDFSLIERMDYLFINKTCSIT